MSTVWPLQHVQLLATPEPLRSILTSYFLLKNVKRIITERLELKKIPENYNLDNLTIINPKGTEKIIMLKKLGVLDYLKEKTPFNTSTNSLASVISTITGIKQSSVYPMIQTIFNPLNPLNRNVSIFVHSCRPSEPNHSLLSDSLHDALA